MIYEASSWVVLIVGLVPAAWFAVSWGRRVLRPWSLAAFDAGGWVYALLAIYLFQCIVYLSLGVPDPPHLLIGVARLLLGVLVDAVIISRAVAWWRLRAAYRRQSEGHRSHRRD